MWDRLRQTGKLRTSWPHYRGKAAATASAPTRSPPRWHRSSRLATMPRWNGKAAPLPSITSACLPPTAPLPNQLARRRISSPTALPPNFLPSSPFHPPQLRSPFHNTQLRSSIVPLEPPLVSACRAFSIQRRRAGDAGWAGSCVLALSHDALQTGPRFLSVRDLFCSSFLLLWSSRVAAYAWLVPT